MTVHPSLKLGLTLNSERVDDLYVRQPIWLDLELKQLWVVEDINPLMSLLRSFPRIRIVSLPVFDMEETFPTVRILFRITIPIKHGNRPKRLFDFDHVLSGTSAAPKVTPPMIFLRS